LIRLAVLAAGFASATVSAVAADSIALELHGYGDYRLVAPSAERSWVSGGLGKTRFGGGTSGRGCG
jgi:hypothetical protein